MSFLSHIRNKVLFLWSLPATIYFNFRHLPFHQAIKLPIFLCMPRILGKGKYEIIGQVKTGMIKLGFPMVSVFREKGIVLENKGKIIFKGTVSIGGGSGISVGDTGILNFGDRFANQSGGKIICYHKITFGNIVRLGWQSLICDTDFHTLKSEDGSSYTKGFGEIEIGDEVWIGSYCKLFKNTEIPNRCTIASGTVINKKIDCRPYSLIYPGGGIKVKHTGYYRDIDDDRIIYENMN